ncbi:chloride channel protein [Hahella sp. SMD15-11]|uniref:Chloride channel protein n=1 Tax=Thermohahella caldifontis TaxID=3142973 RepID=A0AB39UV55_9GAMM
MPSFDFHQYQRRLKTRLGHKDDWKLRVIFWGGALMVGLIISLFVFLAEEAAHYFDQIYHRVTWAPLILTPVMFVAITWLMRKTGPQASGSGIPQVIVALNSQHPALRDKLLAFPTGIVKMILTSLALLAGASVGREGPSVHIGAAMMYQIGKRAGAKFAYMRTAFIQAGGAAGVAAAFNAPLAGIVFAIEELAQAYEARTSGTLILAIIISGIVVVSIYGNYTYFGVTSETLHLVQDWPAVLVVALVGGAAGGLFSLLLQEGNRRVAPIVETMPYRWALLMGLLVAAIGVFSGGLTFGSGYEQASRYLAINAEEGSAAFPLLKFIATLLSYLSGIPGGIFSPSLSTGAGLGGWLAGFFTQAPVQALAILGMTAFLSGVVQRPITSFVIVMELTGEQSMLLPLMIAAVLSNGVSRVICQPPIYHGLAQNLLKKPENSEKAKTHDTTD